MGDGKTWKDYNSLGEERPARPRLLQTLENFVFDSAGMALDLGCGSGRDSKELLKRGWKVDAVDIDPESLELLAPLKEQFSGLNTIASDFATLALVPNTYDLINASYSLPFCKPTHFSGFWRMLQESLRPGGLISCEFFGVNDAWNKIPGGGAGTMTFLSRSELENLLQGWKIELLKETEELGPTAFQGLKHWHLFTCIARKPSKA